MMTAAQVRCPSVTLCRRECDKAPPVILSEAERSRKIRPSAPKPGKSSIVENCRKISKNFDNGNDAFPRSFTNGTISIVEKCRKISKKFDNGNDAFPRPFRNGTIPIVENCRKISKNFDNENDTFLRPFRQWRNPIVKMR